jgi:hypothetical protein
VAVPAFDAVDNIASHHEYPEHYRSTSIRMARIWLQFVDWIDEGLVEFIRTPGDFDRGLWLRIMNTEKQRFEASEELANLAREFTIEKKASPEFDEMKRHNSLLFPPDSYLRRTLRELHPNMSPDAEEAVMTRIAVEREEHPYY